MLSAAGLWPATAYAQISAGLSVWSDDRFRGQSLTSGRPAAILELSYDSPDGPYAGITLTGSVVPHGDAQILAAAENAGYAVRTRAGPTIDFGVTHATYTRYFSGGYRADYTEGYVGIATSRLAAYVRYSPDYFGRGQPIIYAEANAVMKVDAKIRLNAHVGALAELDRSRDGSEPRTDIDWRLGLTRKLGRLDFQISMTGSCKPADLYADYKDDRLAVVVGATYIF